ncbi:MAG: DotU family type IV/VI secretion system protein [Verrucomicrobia bacterium]|nr:DotU family type IV/VI secretion system protein [Verrucomicrobiota bacterium]
MTLLELCEPLFNKICLLNRMGRKGAASVGYEGLRAEIDALLKDLQTRAEAEPALRAQWAKLEAPLIFFVDSMISESALPVAATWNQHRLGYDRKELAGDEKFFDLLDETLADSSADATERLKVFYSCLGLGFCGWYAGQPEYLRGKMTDIASRFPAGEMPSPQDRISPEAYQYVDTRDLIQPRVSRVGGLAVAFLGLCLIVGLVEIYLFRTAAVTITDTAAAVSTLDPRSARNDANPH